MTLKNSIASTVRKPGIYIEHNTKGSGGLPAVADKILVLGHRLAAGTKVAGAAERVFTAAEAREYFGAGSPMALAVQAILEANGDVLVYGMPVDEGGSATAAAGSVALAVSSLTNGTFTFAIGRHLVDVGVVSTDTADVIASSLNAAINADKSLPFSSTASTNTVTLTAKCKGTAGNGWVFASEFTGSGLTPTLTQPSAGATDGDITTALANAAPEQWDVIVSEFGDATNLDEIIGHLDNTSGPMEMRPGIVVAGIVDTLSAATTLGAARNSGRCWLPFMVGTRGHPIEIAAQAAAVLVAEEDRAKPLNNVALPGIPVPDLSSSLLIRSEIESCLANGVTPLNVVAGKVRIVRSVSTYVEDDQGSADDALLDIQTIRTLDYVRAAVHARLQSRFAGKKIASKAKGPNTTDPDQIRGEIIGVLIDLEDLGLVENVSDNADLVVVERHASITTRVDFQVPADIVDGLHVAAGTVDLIMG